MSVEHICIAYYCIIVMILEDCVVATNQFTCANPQPVSLSLTIHDRYKTRAVNVHGARYIHRLYTLLELIDGRSPYQEVSIDDM